MIENYKPDYPYHLCPVCGLPSNTTSRICDSHPCITYDWDYKLWKTETKGMGVRMIKLSNGQEVATEKFTYRVINGELYRIDKREIPRYEIPETSMPLTFYRCVGGEK